MRLLVIGLLAVLAAALLTIVLLVSYHQDQQIIRWFPGTGVAGKLDVVGEQPAYVVIEAERAGPANTYAVLSDGTFLAPLEPGHYRLAVAGDRRWVLINVPEGGCVEIVLDYRIPGLLLRIPGEGLPIPQLAGELPVNR
jgi:hypothetical protein